MTNKKPINKMYKLYDIASAFKEGSASTLARVEKLIEEHINCRVEHNLGSHGPGPFSCVYKIKESLKSLHNPQALRPSLSRRGSVDSSKGCGKAVSKGAYNFECGNITKKGNV